MPHNATLFGCLNIFSYLSPAALKELMTNVTISILNDATNMTWTVVTQIECKPAYVFKDQAHLTGAYAGILAVCLVFVLLEFSTLCQNGTPALAGDFLQIMCATSYGDGTMIQMAREVDLDESGSLPKDFFKLRVRYGLVQASVFERKYAAFSTVKETEVLISDEGMM